MKKRANDHEWQIGCSEPYDEKYDDQTRLKRKIKRLHDQGLTIHEIHLRVPYTTPLTLIRSICK